MQVLFGASASTWLPLLAATMLTFHRPNADLTLEVIPDDLPENKSLRKRERERDREGVTANTGGRADANTHSDARA